MTPLDQCLIEQRACADYRGPDTKGAMAGLMDWMAEECILRMEQQNSYEAFLDQKTQLGNTFGFSPNFVPDFLFDFQKALVEWAVLKGRGGTFADCGLGKTAIQLVWAENIVRKTNGRVLILTPLAVGRQTAREAEKFGITVRRCGDGKLLASDHIVIANYERLHLFDRNDFVGVVCDESSAIKSFNGSRRAEVTEFMRKIPYRLLATATAAPNDYAELGTSSEALGEMGLTDMLGRFFTDQEGRGIAQRSYGIQSKFRFKGHAERPFWRWVCSWARACRKPSDLGFSDEGFLLPELREHEHVVEAQTLPSGMLFSVPARDMREEREERRRTIQERCEKAAQLVDDDRSAVIWCHLNDEGDLLEDLISGSVQVSGGDSDEKKEEAYDGFARGQIKDLIIKPKIGAWGMNWQHCSHVVTFASHSYEQYYQAVRRCWRFGQKNPVDVEIIASEGEVGAKDNLRRKSEAADRMFSELVANMVDELRIKRREYGNQKVEIPTWL